MLPPDRRRRPAPGAQKKEHRGPNRGVSISSAWRRQAGGRRRRATEMSRACGSGRFVRRPWAGTDGSGTVPGMANDRTPHACGAWRGFAGDQRRRVLASALRQAAILWRQALVARLPRVVSISNWMPQSSGTVRGPRNFARAASNASLLPGQEPGMRTLPARRLASVQVDSRGAPSGGALKTLVSGRAHRLASCLPPGQGWQLGMKKGVWFRTTPPFIFAFGNWRQFRRLTKSSTKRSSSERRSVESATLNRTDPRPTAS